MHMKNTITVLLLDNPKNVKEDHENYKKRREIFFDKLTGKLGKFL